MSASVANGTLSDDPLKSVADALETAVQAARDGAADARAAIEGTLPVATGILSRLAYRTCYAFSYGIVFPTALVVRSIPKNNVIVNGFIDGAHAAGDKLDNWKNR